MVAMPQRNMMAASQVEGATFLRMMLLGTWRVWLVRLRGEAGASRFRP